MMNNSFFFKSFHCIVSATVFLVTSLLKCVRACACLCTAKVRNKKNTLTYVI